MARSGYIVGLLTATYALSVVDRNLLSITLDAIKHDLVLSDSMMGLIIGFGFSALQAVAGLPIARWGDRADRPFIIAGAVTLWSVMTCLCGAAQSGLQLMLARMGVGIGEATTPVYHSLIADLYDRNRRARALAILGCGMPLGVLIGFPIGGALAQHFGWRGAFVGAGVPGILCALLVYATVSDPARGGGDEQGFDAKLAPLGVSLRYILSQPSYTLLLLGQWCNGVTMGAVIAWTPAFLHRLHHMSMAQIGGTVELVNGAAGLVGALLGGVVVEQAAKRRDVWRLLAPGIALYLIAPAVLVASFTGSTSVAIASFGVIAFMSAFQFGPVLAVSVTVVKVRMRSLASSIQAFTSALIGLGLGPLYVGFFNDHFSRVWGPGAIRIAFATATIGVVVGATLFVVASRFVGADIARSAGLPRQPPKAS